MVIVDVASPIKATAQWNDYTDSAFADIHRAAMVVWENTGLPARALRMGTSMAEVLWSHPDMCDRFKGRIIPATVKPHMMQEAIGLNVEIVPSLLGVYVYNADGACEIINT